MRIIGYLFLIFFLCGCSSALVSASPTLSIATDTPQPRASSPSAQPAGNADVVFVRVVQAADESWTFNVTVQHPDTGWEDYADGWDVLTLDGTVLKRDAESQFTRTLLHPHVEEQPGSACKSSRYRRWIWRPRGCG